MNPYHRPVMMEGMLKHEISLRSFQFELDDLLAQLRESPAITISLIGPSGVGKSYLLSLLADPGKVWMHDETAYLMPDAERCLFVLIDGGNPYVAREIEAGHSFHIFLNQLRVSLLGFALVYQEKDDAFGGADAIRRAATIAPRSYAQLWTELLASGSIPDTPAHLIAERFRAKLTHLQYGPQHEHLEHDLKRLGEHLCPRLDQPLERDGEVPTTEAQFEDLSTLLKAVVRLNFRVVFLIDEFDALMRYLQNTQKHNNEHMQHLRELVAHYSFVIASDQALSKIVPDEFKTVSFATLLRSIRPVQLDMLSVDNARRIIEKVPEWAESLAPGNIKQIRFSAADIHFILELSGTHLELIRRNCEQLFSWMSRRDDIVAGQDLLTSAEKPYYRAKLRPLFHDVFATIWHDLSERERTMLYNIASGNYHTTPSEPNRFPLSRLIELGYVVYRAETRQYALFAGLFQDYVLDIYDMHAAQIGHADHATEQPRERNGHYQNGILSPAIANSLVGLERNLFNLLNTNPGKVVTRDEIAQALYPGEEQQPRQRIDTLVSRLRSKLKDTDLTIISHRGQGYELLSPHQR